jgi:trimeric autotransporter adhesin
MKTTTSITYPAFALFALAYFGLSPQAGAACHEGCDIPGGNTFLGNEALANTTGSVNTAIGLQALASNTTGGGNTATGAETMLINSTGIFNTATGVDALLINSTGNNNTATGVDALRLNTGSNNIALGSEAGANLTTGDNNIHIGNAGVSGESGIIRIGTVETQTNAYIAGIYQTTVARGLVVKVDSTGHLGTVGSSKRFKEAIKPMDKASEAVLALKPVTFHYKKELDPDGIAEFGLVAEDVEKINPDLVVRDNQGKPYTVRYDAVNAMLLNEFLKEHRAFLKEERKVEVQEKTIAELKSGMTALAATVKEQASQIQKVSAQLEASKPAPQVVNNP